VKRFKDVLVVANPDGFADALLARAAWLADANGARLTLLDVDSRDTSVFAGLLGTLGDQSAQAVGDQLAAARAEVLDAAADRLRAGGAVVETIQASGIGFLEVIRRVLSAGHDLVLKFSETSRSWQVLGGPDLHLLRKCPCPVWVLNSAMEPKAKRIVAAVDPDPDDATRDALNQKVMQLATSLAQQDGAHVDVLNAWYLPEEHLLRSARVRTPPEQIEALVDKTRRDSLIRLKALTDQYKEFESNLSILHLKGVPEDIIAQHALGERIDTLVMGTLGRTGLAGMFIGNTAETVLGRVKCSILAIKPDGFISPVKLEGQEDRG